MKKRKIEIKGKKLECYFCGNDEFFEFSLNTPIYHAGGISSLFFGKIPKIYVCSNCGLKQEFFKIK